MHAAVVTAFGRPPRYQQHPDPRPAEGEVLVRVLAAGLHPRVHGDGDRRVGDHRLRTRFGVRLGGG
ncbi:MULTISPECIES: hypothetical protein [Streptomyces]|uniref:Uncharacterized protein n=2 Tax=Streptomyces TaxID=1883 RepID=A0A2N8PAZ5_STRNR|nr:MULTISPECIES: hypothetical protein [Streptomyces]PNE38162.1 hypothetical protein AOB60_29105 [Streptomyces noursei]SHL82997.1 hypothetical protein SAMN05216268_106342 [Streptomyces yunnanensis]